MDMLSSLWSYDEDKKPMPSISSSDMKPFIKKVAEEEKILLYRDLFELPENKGKSIKLDDYHGTWIISNYGYQLTRIHKQIDHPPLQSYIYGNPDDQGKCQYIMTNGEKIRIHYQNALKRIVISHDNFLSIYHDKYEWI